MFELIPSSIDFIRAAKLRALTAMTATRLEIFPDLPTVNEFVPGYEASSFAGIGVLRNTPPDIVDRLNKEINAGLAAPTAPNSG
jgi:tripartite-type tricarboxylate transporter receptor subunit TctC